MNKKIFSSIFILFIVITSFGVYAQSSFAGNYRTASEVRYQNAPGSYHGSISPNEYWPALNNREVCQNRQDLLVKVAPFGCQPMVVRSDLLAEQNVPVFCQLEGLNVNPFLDIERLGRPTFSGNYPSEFVSTIGYYPSIARLDKVNNVFEKPQVNNLGYVVIVLKKQPNEEAIPEKVEFDLSVKFPYQSSGSFGVGGDGEFLLEVLDDAEWEDSKYDSQILNDQYYLRLDDVDENQATVSVYAGDRRIGTTNARLVGTYEERSGVNNFIRIPESYCNAGVEVKYQGFVSGRDTAVLEINGNSFEVYEGSKFYNNKCTVRDLNLLGEGAGNITFKCLGNKEINLELKTKVSDSVSDNDLSSEAEEYYLKSFDEYETLKKEYKEVYVDQNENNVQYGKLALLEQIELAKKFNPEEAVKLKEQLLREYGSIDEKSLEKEQNLCIDFDCSENSADIYIADEPLNIRLLKFKAPDKPAEAEMVIDNQKSLVKLGERISLNENGDNYFILTNVLDRSVEVTTKCSSDPIKPNVPLSISSDFNKVDTICGKNVRLLSVDKSDFARITLSSGGAQTESLSNFTVSIGLEKRAIKLNPEKTQEKIDNLDKSIEKWKGISDGLGKLTDGFQTACFATSAALTVKNFFTGLGGESLAREKVMSGNDGWVERCEHAVATGKLDSDGDGKEDRDVSYATINVCFNDNKELIDGDIDARLEVLQSVDSRIEEVQNSQGITNEGLADSSVNVDKAKVAYLAKLKSIYREDPLLENITEANLDKITYRELRDLDEALALKASGNSANGVAGEKAYDSIKDRITPSLETQKLIFGSEDSYGQIGKDTGSLRIVEAPLYKETNGKVLDKQLTGISLTETQRAMFVVGIPTSSPQGTPPERFILVGENPDEGKPFSPTEIYKITSDPSQEEYEITSAKENVDLNTFKSKYSVREFTSFTGDYNYEIAEQDRVVHFFESGPYSGLPALVPFDIKRGFYVKVEAVLGIGGAIASYDSAGRPKSFSICNVGSDFRIDDSDRCRGYQIGINDDANFPGMNAIESRNLLNRAIEAINDARDQKDRGTIDIEGYRMNKVAAYDGPKVTCQEFMSPEDCSLLFNTCDPVVCPTSRCNLGGQYQVADVVQTGIIGSALLCLPNVREGIVMPVCLTGIKSGVDGYLSILQAHKACLAESLTTGSQTGICDAITSVYTCEFFWRQAGPIADAIIPKVFDAFTGKGARGGGEYLFAQEAWQNTKDSVDYMNNYYGGDALRAFNIKSVAEAGTQFCRSFISMQAPTSIEGVLEPRSPPQFHAVFSEIPYTDATAPATSQYKVFYHIFAGNERGVGYTVYLKDPPSATTYSIQQTVVVDSNYVSVGSYASETRDFTAPAGYKQLCVRINDGFKVQEECGFGQVTTSFAGDYLTDKFVSDEVENNNIKTETECIAGEPNAVSVFSASPQESVQEVIAPQAYDRGIVRICSSENPGTSTNPNRYVDVGYCDSESMRCWLDKQSVNNAISDKSLAGESLQVAENKVLDNLNLPAGTTDTEISNLGKEINNLRNLNAKDTEAKAIVLVNKVDELNNKAFYDYQSARLISYKAELYKKVAEAYSKEVIVAQTRVAEVTETTSSTGAKSSVEKSDSTSSDETPEVVQKEPSLEEIELAKYGVVGFIQGNSVPQAELYYDGQLFYSSTIRPHIYFRDLYPYVPYGQGRILIQDIEQGIGDNPNGEQGVQIGTVDKNGFIRISESFLNGETSLKGKVSQSTRDMLKVINNKRIIDLKKTNIS